MTNTTLFKTLIDRYNAVAYTHEYIWGFEYKGNIYMARTSADVMPFVCKLDKASRGCGFALRFVPTVAQKLTLMTSAVVLCSKKFFEEEVSNSIYNRGEIFEKMVTEYFGQVWEKDNVPFTDDGDITVNGIAYQIKYQKATFCNEKSIANLEA
jgi:hypothetical protein